MEVDRATVLARARAAWRAAAQELPGSREELEEELPYLPLELQVPIFEALRWAGFEALQRAVKQDPA